MRLVTIAFAACLLAFVSNAQTPQALNYQAVARNGVGQIIPSQNIGIRFSVIDGTATGTTVYQETFTTLTNNFGLFTLAIGKGTPVTGTFAAINWAVGDKFLKVEIAPQGGTNYTVQGTTQFLSVPYAQYSERTKLLAGNNTILVTNGNTITGNYQPANNTITIAGNAIAGNYQAANNTVLVTGNTIAGNYQPANNTVLVTGNTIAGNYQAANNTVLVAGNTIAGNYQAANNTVLVTGNTIAGNYQAANNTVLVAGNTIAGNYQAANNTVLVTGNTIAGNYQAANNTVLVTGNTIAANYQAGTGISITGNTIAATGSNTLWIADANGIHNQSGAVGIGTNSSAGSKLSILQVPTGGFSASLDLASNDTWHTSVRFRNMTVNQEWQIMVGGSGNTYQRAASLAFYNTNTGPTPWTIYADAPTSYVGIGSYTPVMPEPRSRLHVFNGDVNVDQIGSGIILKSPNGSCWRITIDNAGNLVRTAIACP
jgi:carbonic anhydrase